MNMINATTARKNLYNILSDTCNGNPLIITSKAGNCILVSEEEWNSLQETSYLMSNKKTRDDIMNGINTSLDDCEDTLPW